MGYQSEAATLSPGASWSLSVERVSQQPSQQLMLGMPGGPDPAQALRNDHNEYVDEVMDYTNGGMFSAATSYEKSYFTCGCKFWDPNPPHRLMVCTSTAASNRRSLFDMGMEFLSFEVWTSWEDDHIQAIGGGMNGLPGGLEKCEYEGIAGEYFRNKTDVGYEQIASLEDLLYHAGILEYERFICGYNIHGNPALVYDSSGKYCGLDWYSQSNNQRVSSPEVWAHYIITDQVCPILGYKARAYTRQDLYAGWHDFVVGG